MENKKPRLTKAQMRFDIMDWFYEAGGWVLLIVLWGYLILQFDMLPQSIPTHFAMDGTADGFSNKSNIFILPAVVTVLYLGMTILNRFPHRYNYLVTITPLNANRNYTRAMKMVRFIKFLVVILFCFICYQSVQVALGESTGLGKWFLPFAVIFFLLIVLFTLFRSIRFMHPN